MKLKSLKEEKCPICGCNTIVQESVDMDTIFDRNKIRTHANGGRWEHRKFACGLRLSYIPNFGKSEIDSYSVCRNDKKHIEKEKNELMLKN